MWSPHPPCAVPLKLLYMLAIQHLRTRAPHMVHGVPSCTCATHGAWGSKLHVRHTRCMGFQAARAPHMVHGVPSCTCATHGAWGSKLAVQADKLRTMHDSKRMQLAVRARAQCGPSGMCGLYMQRCALL
eukprot:363469-Chlamydomonas_euryale.AAC.3